MVVLGIETSCDETSVALVDDRAILANIISTQQIHEKYGGVVPEFASRAHLRQLSAILRAALQESGMSLPEVDALAVTYGPGLAGSLLVGLCFCKGLAISLRKPWIGVNHLEGHIMANATEVDYPHIGLLASGGHTMLIRVDEPLRHKVVGRTIDDAAGEAFDKVAKVLGLGYPGGPAIERIAAAGNPTAIRFPRALRESDNLDFSFSGLKTAVLYHAQSVAPSRAAAEIPHIAASFQQAVIDALWEKSLRALSRFQVRSLVLAGGVMRNSTLRRTFEARCNENGLRLTMPSPELCTDNAAMIARAGLLRLKNGERSDLALDVAPNLKL